MHLKWLIKNLSLCSDSLWITVCSAHTAWAHGASLSATFSCYVCGCKNKDMSKYKSQERRKFDSECWVFTEWISIYIYFLSHLNCKQKLQSSLTFVLAILLWWLTKILSRCVLILGSKKSQKLYKCTKQGFCFTLVQNQRVTTTYATQYLELYFL